MTVEQNKWDKKQQEITRQGAGQEDSIKKQTESLRQVQEAVRKGTETLEKAKESVKQAEAELAAKLEAESEAKRLEQSEMQVQAIEAIRAEYEQLQAERDALQVRRTVEWVSVQDAWKLKIQQKMAIIGKRDADLQAEAAKFKLEQEQLAAERVRVAALAQALLHECAQVEQVSAYFMRINIYQPGLIF